MCPEQGLDMLNKKKCPNATVKTNSIAFLKSTCQGDCRLKKAGILKHKPTPIF
jgi:hypothetical protein